jgi:hypothetical protein
MKGIIPVIWCIACFAAGLAPWRHAYAQLTVNPGAVSFTINNATLYRNGNSITYTAHLQQTLLLSVGWSLTVRASSANLTSGANSIPAGNVKVQVTSATYGSSNVPGPFPVVSLSNSNQAVIPSSGLVLGLLSTLRVNLKYTVAGDANLLKPAGTYATQLTFTLNNVLLSYSANVSFSVVLANYASIAIQGGGSTAALSFSTPNDYKNGVQLNQAQALNVFSNQSYKVAVKAAQNLKNGLEFIPIGNISLQPVPSPSATGLSASTAALSLSDQNIITSSAPTLSQNFNLKYYTQPANAAFLNKPAGTYTSTLVYTITAP